jgi:hypothetical protein
MGPRVLVLLGCASACIKGNSSVANFDGPGGSLAIPGCDYTLVTRSGAEAPSLGTSAHGDDPTPRFLHLGIMGDARTSMVLQWRTVDETTQETTVRYGVGADLTADQLTQTATGVQFGYLSDGAVYREHQGHLCGLAPGTTYSYQVGSEGHFSAVHTFHTAPDLSASPDAETMFAFLGDSRGGYDIWAQLIALAQQRMPDLVLFSGDAVTTGTVQSEWEQFFGTGEPLFASVPLVSAQGNHEINAVNYYSQIAMPGDQEVFGFDYGAAHIFVANDTPVDPNAIFGGSRAAIDTDLAAHESAPWKLFVNHQPIWSASTRHGSTLSLQNAWMPLFDQHHVDVVLNGHDHDFEVSHPMKAGLVQATAATGTIYVVGGGAGAELYQNGSGSWTAYSESVHSLGILRVRVGSLVMDAVRPDGTPLPGGFTITK